MSDPLEAPVLRRRPVRMLRLHRLQQLVPVMGANAGFALPDGALDEVDPLAQMAHADAADASLLRLVLCAATATLALAIASSLL